MKSTELKLTPTPTGAAIAYGETPVVLELGVGVPIDVPPWGGMLSGASSQYVKLAPWLAVFPGIAIAVVVFSWNVLGDALRDVLDPRLKGTN